MLYFAHYNLRINDYKPNLMVLTFEYLTKWSENIFV